MKRMSSATTPSWIAFPSHDVNATALRLLGIDHKKLTYRFQGRNFRLTDLEGNVITKIIA